MLNKIGLRIQLTKNFLGKAAGRIVTVTADSGDGEYICKTDSTEQMSEETAVVVDEDIATRGKFNANIHEGMWL